MKLKQKQTDLWLWASEWACKLFFLSIDRYWWDQYISVNIFYLA